MPPETPDTPRPPDPYRGVVPGALLRLLPWAFGLCYLVFALHSPLIFVDTFGFIAHADELPGRWLDGFYPCGYPLMLRGLFELVGDYRVAAAVLTAASAVLALQGIACLASRLSGTPGGGLAALALTAIQPQFVYWATTASTEMPALAGILWGLAWLARPAAARRDLAGGLCLGAAYCIRFAAAPAAVAAALWLAVQPARRRGVVAFTAGWLAAALPQWLPSAYLRGNPAWNYQAKNVWFGLHGHWDWDRNWARVSDDISLTAAVDGNWSSLAAHWAGNLITAAASLWTALTPGLLLLVLAGAVVGLRGRSRAATLLLLVTAAVLAASTALAFVHLRLMFVPAMILVPLAPSALAAWAGRRPRRAATLLAIALLLELPGFYRWQGAHPRLAVYARLAPLLRRAGMRNALEVATMTSLEGDFLYDPASRRKLPFMPVPLSRGDVEGLLETLARRGKRFVVVESAGARVYPGLRVLLEEGPSPPGLRRLARWRFAPRLGWPEHRVGVYALDPLPSVPSSGL